MSEGNRFTATKPELPSQLSDELDQLSAEKKYRYLQFSVDETTKSLAELNEKVKDIAGFWAAVITSHPALKNACTSSSDNEALSYLTKIELKQDKTDPRPYEIVFHFKENPFFSNSTLTKTYSLPEELPAIKDGKVNKSTWDYEADSLVTKGTKIDWKDEDHNLTKKQPRTTLTDDDEDDPENFEGDIGSFFWFFEDDADPLNIGHYLQDDVLPDAYEYFTGEANEDDEDFEEYDELDDEEDDEDDDASVDLEDEDDQPKKKKQRK